MKRQHLNRFYRKVPGLGNKWGFGATLGNNKFCTIHSHKALDMEKFYQWFLGFSEGEGCFKIKPKNSR